MLVGLLSHPRPKGRHRGTLTCSSTSPKSSRAGDFQMMKTSPCQARIQVFRVPGCCLFPLSRACVPCFPSTEVPPWYSGCDQRPRVPGHHQGTRGPGNQGTRVPRATGIPGHHGDQEGVRLPGYQRTRAPGLSAQMTTTARIVSKSCARTRSECPEMFFST